MGRHAGGGGPSHPLVAAALTGRPTGAGAHRPGPRADGTEGDRADGTEGGLGWPGPPDREGGGLGWPGDAQDTAPAAPAHPRRGWRRWFGAEPAA